MLDPIGGFNRIREYFISYVETSFRISDQLATQDRRQLLESANVLATSPFLEPVLRYQSSDTKLEDLAQQEGGPLEPLSKKGKIAFAELALSGLFEGEPASGPIRRRSLFAPYAHQVAMLERGLKPGHPGIVTSGTGSGKTESFMLPVLAAIANEAVTWGAPNSSYLGNQWWAEARSSWGPRRAGENRPAAVRALILYPMNALVEDQMVRLRRTLDSDTARQVMDDRFDGNRIFFGQYTSATPVTGHEKHPRMPDEQTEKARRSRRHSRLRLALQRYDDNQAAARKHDQSMAEKAAANGEPPPEKTRYIFPSLDGGEMMSRWDMHKAPPDLLVTNASMLGAMLSREVEDPIFEQTKQWLLADKDAYFYLIFDELHLVRGSAGTEIAFLIKSLIERLGLDDPQHRHKLRILASSASLPMNGDKGIQSRSYLRDLFAPFGTSTGSTDPGSTDPDFWAACVVEGLPNMPRWSGGKLDPAPFATLFQAAIIAGEEAITTITATPAISTAMKQAALALGVSGASEADLVRNMAEAAAAVLTTACLDGNGVRATAAPEIAGKVFVSGDADLDHALRGLMLVRALPESGQWRAKVSLTTPAFRLHTFIRNIEGLFAAPTMTTEGVRFSHFTVERGVSHAPPAKDKQPGRRLFELLYCEACGDLLLGGQRGQASTVSKSTELLPAAVNLEQLPERAANEYYDSMTLDEFAVFWPRAREPLLPELLYDSWEPAYLDPETGVVTVDKTVPPGRIGGHLYHQTDAAVSGKKPKSAQPFCCPKCGTDYSNRPASNRMRSPIRAFRTGVSKASQLVATELFALLHAIGAEPKGIAFSDSRQDAANQALEIERLHLRDLRREVLVATARDCVEKADPDWLTEAEYASKFNELIGAGKTTEAVELATKNITWRKMPPQPRDRRINLGQLLQFGKKDGGLGDLVSSFIEMGIHPFDPVGRKHFQKQPWHAFFADGQEGVSYARTLDNLSQDKLNNLILEKQYELIDDVIFSRSFFALEETGLAYPGVAARDGTQSNELDAWLRIFAGAYRVQDNQYHNSGQVRAWVRGQDVTNKRVRLIANKIFGESATNQELSEILQKLDQAGHYNGLFKIEALYLRVAQAADPYWRCTNCERVHLHTGIGRCTRCGDALPTEPRGKCEDLWRSNFLGRRIVRSLSSGGDRFRLRVEELTGQTDDFSDRLRKFKGIFVDDETDIQKRAAEIDMLSVTTTMEVGIDIGALQSVYQANMPPQRFNYQQRVGRAGRRGQAFSFVITFCRGRSHDAYYFVHPKAITGDPPPPPFLAVEHDPIPMRLLRKAWLRMAFQLLRKQCAERKETYPGDLLNPPDVHGEYVTTRDYFHSPAVDWRGRLRQALCATIASRDSFILAATFDSNQQARLREEATVDKLLADIEALAPHAPNSAVGLARFFAEWGLLPMYGMPTRVRNLYLGLRTDGDGQDADLEWSTMDRDLDLAVFEFAPGAILTKDKLKHRVIGFTGNLMEPQRRKGKIELLSASSWIEASIFIAICPACGAAKLAEHKPEKDTECDDCHEPIPSDRYRLYITPSGFRTDFQPRDDLEDVGRMAVRTVATVLKEGDPVEIGHVTVRRGAGVTIMQMNDGVPDADGVGQHFAASEVFDKAVPSPRGKDLEIEGMPQAIHPDYFSSGNVGRWQTATGVNYHFGLVARKQTDAVYLELGCHDDRLDLSRVAKDGSNSYLPARAAAISATQILVQKAALELDVAPDEFEALEPRVRSGRPVLQIADALINGSGLCRRLGDSITSSRPPRILELVHEMLAQPDQWPLQDFVGHDLEDLEHANQCRTSCYRCIQRFGNRRYHGLLDWRLGLSYLRALVDENYACGLRPDEATLPEILGWRERAHELAQAIANMRPTSLSYLRLKHADLPCLIEKLDSKEVARIVVVHPLWKSNKVNMKPLLGPDWTDGLKFADTFNLERRPLRTLAELKKGYGNNVH
jgi:hypothetical protein